MHTNPLYELAHKRVNIAMPASERARTYTGRRSHTNRQRNTETPGGLIDLLSSPPVVYCGFWLGPVPPFKGSAVV